MPTDLRRAADHLLLMQRIESEKMDVQEKEYFDELLSKNLLYSIKIFDCDICEERATHHQIVEGDPDGRGGVYVEVYRLCQKHNDMYGKLYGEKLINASRS